MLANPLKGEVAILRPAGDLKFCLTFPAQKACELKFGRRFLDLAEDLDELLLTDVGFIFWAGLQHYQPTLTEAQVDEIVTELGVLAMYKILGVGVRASFDQGEVAPAASGPRKARGRPTQ